MTPAEVPESESTNQDSPPGGEAGEGVPREWFRGVLEPCLLALLAEGESYGYELAGRLEAAGFGPVPGGTLYPALLRLEKQGLVASLWRPGGGGPGRKYYRLVDQGRATLARQADQWDGFARTVGSLLREGATP